MKKHFFRAGLLGLMFIAFIILVRRIDVAPIGPEGTAVGFSHINRVVSELFGLNLIWYSITQGLGIAALLTAFIFALAGAKQMISRKSLLKVDPEILSLGGLFAVVIVLYILFEKVVINYRPVIMPGEAHPEASFPSSHTMLICVVFGAAAMLTDRYIENQRRRILLRALCIAVILITVIGRLICGVHWFTDIIGGLLISLSLLSLYAGILEFLERRSGYEEI